MNKNNILKKSLFWICMPTLGAMLLAAVNLLAPSPPKIELPSPPSKYTVGCFIGGQSVFMGDILGPIRVSPKGEIVFFSLDWNVEVRLINAGCISMEGRLTAPTVYKEGDTKNDPDHTII